MCAGSDKKQRYGMPMEARQETGGREHRALNNGGGERKTGNDGKKEINGRESRAANLLDGLQ